MNLQTRIPVMQSESAFGDMARRGEFSPLPPWARQVEAETKNFVGLVLVKYNGITELLVLVENGEIQNFDLVKASKQTLYELLKIAKIIGTETIEVLIK